MQKILVIQTAFTGDVVLATALLEKLHDAFPAAVLHLLVRRGNEGLLAGHPFLEDVLVWDKGKNKTKNLVRLISRVRRARYSHVINLHRFGSSGLITALSGAQFTAGFDKNPLSFLFTHTARHIISPAGTASPIHEVERNQQLIAPITDAIPAMPKLYPTAADRERVASLCNLPYACISPASVWATKQFPADQWARLCDALTPLQVYLLGGPGDRALGAEITRLTRGANVRNLCGDLRYLESAALMAGAVMNYANDSAPLHMASALNAPITAVFCSTVPRFGFGPLSTDARVVECPEHLPCRPCGLHGHRACPEGHFRCAKDIVQNDLLWWTTAPTNLT